MKLHLILFYASTNTRIFDHLQKMDNKHDTDKLVQNVLKANFVEKLTQKREPSIWKLFEFLSARFDIHEMTHLLVQVLNYLNIY